MIADLGRSPVTSNKLMGREHWIEALIVADETIVRFHGKDKVEKYLLVLSNMVSNCVCYVCLFSVLTFVHECLQL